jgi:4-amino-4-deoxy-L-arabinose transferase-like glycosyltransferase
MPPVKNEGYELEINLEIRQGERVRLVLNGRAGQQDTPPPQSGPAPAPAPRLNERGNLLRSIAGLSEPRAALLLFLLALLVYAIVMGIRPVDFPPFELKEEQQNANLAENLLQPDLQGRLGQFSPACILVETLCLPTGPVYFQIVPQILFGRALWAGRGMGFLAGLAAAVCFSMLLRSLLQNRLWWSAPLWLALSPGWFALGRTASGGVLLALCWAGMLYCYLRYREGRSRCLLGLMLCAALSLYTTFQAALGTLFLLLWMVAEYILANRRAWPPKDWRTALAGLALGILVAFPWLASPINSVQGVDLGDFLGNYLYALSPALWLARGPQETLGILLPDYAAFPWLALPFALFGFFLAVRGYRDYRLRALLAALLIYPIGAAAALQVSLAEVLPLLLPTLALATYGLSTGLNSLHARRIYWIGLFAILSLLAFLMLNTALT